MSKRYYHHHGRCHGQENWEWDALGAWAREAGRSGARWVSLVEGLLRTGAYVEPELDETLAEFGLTRPSFQVLVALLRVDGHRLTQRELSRLVRRTSGTMSMRLARLEEAGLVMREPDPEDGRGVIVTLTDEGKRRVESALPAYAAACERLGVALEGDDVSDLAAKIGAWLGFFESGASGGETGPRLGIIVAPAHVAQRMRRAVGLPERMGVLVRRVRPDGPADRAGLQPGDLITAADGAEIRAVDDLHRALSAAVETGTLHLDVVRGVEERTVDVTLTPAS
jgi:DNA-binding MarR family transcriptional regulator